MKNISWQQVTITMVLGIVVFFITKELEKRFYPDS